VKAIRIDELGPLENLKLVDMEIPEPGPNEVLIKTEVIGVMFADARLYEADKFPHVPGQEVTGIVAKVGEDVTDLREGMRVGAWTGTGAYAEYAVANEGLTFELPDHVSFQDAIVYQSNFIVAYAHYSVSGKVKSDDTLLIHAGAGGVGTLLTHIAKKHGNTVISLCSTEEKCRYCLSNSADYAINYREVDYVDEVLKITDGKGVDVSFNSVAGPTFETDFNAIRPFGRWVIYGYAGGRAPLSADAIDALRVRSLDVKVASIMTLFGTSHFSEIIAYFKEWVATEKLLSPSKVYQLDQAVEALKFIAGQQSIGKVVLVP